MHRNQALPSHQHNRIDHYKKLCDSHSMFNSLTSHRERLYPPTEMQAMALTVSDLFIGINRPDTYFTNGGLPPSVGLMRPNMAIRFKMTFGSVQTMKI